MPRIEVIFPELINHSQIWLFFHLVADGFVLVRGDTKREFFRVRSRRKGLRISLNLDSVVIYGAVK